MSAFLIVDMCWALAIDQHAFAHSLALKHDILLQGELATAVKTVLESLKRSVRHQESTYKSALELHARREAEAKSHYRENGEELERPVPPDEPPVRERYLPEILEFLVSTNDPFA